MSTGLKQAASRPASVLQTFRAVAWSFFGVRRSSDHAQDVQKLNPRARRRRRRGRRRAVRLGARVAGSLGGRQRRRRLTQRPRSAVLQEQIQASRIEEQSAHVGQRTPGATPYYFVPAPSRHPALVAFGLFFVILGAGQWINGARLGRLCRCCSGCVLWLSVLFQWFRALHRARAKAACTAAHRCVVPLEHELVHLLGGDVLRRLLRRVVLMRASSRCRRWAASNHQVLWPDFKAAWPTRRGRLHRVAGRHRRAVRDDGRRGRCRRSTRRCC